MAVRTQMPYRKCRCPGSVTGTALPILKSGINRDKIETKVKKLQNSENDRQFSLSAYESGVKLCQIVYFTGLQHWSGLI